jgi:Leucine-rich repeat (LRR) protein
MSTTKIHTAEDIFKGRLRGNQLMASGIPLTFESARYLWSSSKMADVTWLDLADNQLGDTGLIELAECELLKNVQYLNLNQNGITDEGLTSISKSKILTKLKRLHLKNNLITGLGIVDLYNSATLNELSTFQIHDGWTCKKMDGWRYNPQG